MSKSEYIFNILTGFSILSWALSGIIADAETSGITPIRICITVINSVTGFIFLVRKPLARQGTNLSIVLSLPSLFASGLAYKLALPTDAWPGYAELVFIAGTVITVTSFLYLGRYFSVFPAVRGVAVSGPYRVIRHPAYFGELLMVSGCFFAGPRIACIALIIAGIGVVIRISLEEKLLSEDAAYKEYAEKVVWRLFPGIW